MRWTSREKQGVVCSMVTVDVAGVAPSDRMNRGLPSSISIRTALGFLPEAWSRPRWLVSFLRGGLSDARAQCAAKTQRRGVRAR